MKDDPSYNQDTLGTTLSLVEFHLPVLSSNDAQHYYKRLLFVFQNGRFCYRSPQLSHILP